MVLHILRNASDPHALKVIRSQRAQGEAPMVALLDRPSADAPDGAVFVCENPAACGELPAGAEPVSWEALVEKIFAADVTAVW